MRAILCGGGTAGHITPAISIAETILHNEPDSEILFVGRKGGDENEIVLKGGYSLKTIDVAPIVRKFNFQSIKSLFGILGALKESRKIIEDWRPDVVIGTGGYVSWPVARAAIMKNIPVVMHESNAVPGKATKMLAKKCAKVLLNFPVSDGVFPEGTKLVTVGNPLREDIEKISRAEARRRLGFKNSDFVILSFGGSGGADVLNKSVIRLMQSYSSKIIRVKHIHATGKKYFAKIKEEFPLLSSGRLGTKIYPFINDMPTYLRSADIVISRCGAMTLSEVAAVGAIPILIPSPNVTDNHQYKNGRLLADKGAAIMIEESELCDRALYDAVRYLEANPGIRAKMREALSTFHVKNSCEIIYREISDVLRQNTYSASN